MKKFIIAFTASFILFSQVFDTHAVSYGGSSVFSLPDAGISSSSTTFYQFRNHGAWGVGSQLNSWQPVSVPLPVISDFSYTSITRILSYNFWFAVKHPYYSFSGNILNLQLSGGWPCNPFVQWCSQNVATVSVSRQPLAFQTGWVYHDQYRIKLYDGSVTYGSDGNAFDTLVFDDVLFDVPSNETCPGMSIDCVMIFLPAITMRNTTIVGGTWIAYIDIIYYNTTDNKAQSFRRWFWNLSDNWLERDWKESFTAWLIKQNVRDDYGQRISSNVKTLWAGSSFSQAGGSWVVSAFNYRPVVAPATDDWFFREFLMGTGNTTFDMTLADWFNIDGIYVDSSTPISSGWNTGSGYYQNCGLNVGCYIKDSWNWIAESFNSLKTKFWSFFDFSIVLQGGTNNCFSSGSTAYSWSVTSISYFQKVANLFSLVIPIPPAEWQPICTLDGLKTMQYRRANDWDFLSPQIYNTPAPFGVLDQILILVFSAAAAMYVFSLTHKSNKDD